MFPIISKYFVYYPYYFVKCPGFRLQKRLFEETQWLSRETIAKTQLERLRKILEFAYENSPFYRKKFDRSGIVPRDIQHGSDLMRVPILTKCDLKKYIAEVAANRHLKQYHLKQTSGSSGQPVQVIKDGASLAVMDAVMYRNYGWYGIEIGDRQARFWGSPQSRSGQAKNRFRDFLLNRDRFSPFNISEKSCNNFIARMYRFLPSHVYGYAQTVHKFSQYVLKRNIDLSPLKLKAVIVTGEMIFKDQMETIRRAFQSHVANEYGCTELGIIAMSCPRGGMHLMAENLFVEIVKNGKPVQPGEEGDIIITELNGAAMPLIRYQVGDVGYAEQRQCECGRGLPLLGGIKGRNDDFIVSPSGRQIDPIVFEYVLREIPNKFGKISQFRIIQEKSYRLHIEVCYKGQNRDIMFRELVEKLTKALGEGFTIKLLNRESIPPEPSGKQRCFISRLKEQYVSDFRHL